MRWFTQSQRYEKVAADSTEDVLQHPSELSSQTSARDTLARHVNIVFFVANVVFLAATLRTAQHVNSANWSLKRTNTYTPMLNEYDFTFQKVKNNASLYNTPYSVYKDDPSPKVDAAWEAIAETPVLVISKEDVVAMGKDPDYAVPVPEEFGFGPSKFFAANDGQHLVHCLNEVRKFAYYDYYHAPSYGPASNLPPMVAAHRSHCLGVLLDALTCQPSLNLVVWEWMEGMQEPWPDFNVWRKCVDHGAFYEWQKEKQVDRKLIGEWDWKKSVRTKEKPAEKEVVNGGGGEGLGHAHAQGDGHGGREHGEHWS